MSMPGSDMRPDDGPYTECVDCGASIRVIVLEDDEEPLCEQCTEERALVDRNDALPTGPCPVEGAGDHGWTSDEDPDHAFCDACGTSYEDWAAIEIADLRLQVQALTAQRDAALADVLPADQAERVEWENRQRVLRESREDEERYQQARAEGYDAGVFGTEER